jgi:hypothetical protein
MKDYLLSVYQPDGPPPPPEALHKVMQDVGAVIEDAKRAGVWVFNGGLHPPAPPQSCASRAVTRSSPTGPTPKARSTSAAS